MDEDAERYERGRREHRTRVGVGIAAVLGAIVLLVVRFGIRRDRDDTYAPQPAYVAPPTVPAAALLAAHDPIEFQLVVGSDRFDIIPDQRLDLPGGANLVLEQNPTWVTAGAGYHFKHRSSVSISPSPDMVIASTDGTVVKLQAMDAKATDAESKKLLSSSIVDTGQTVGAPTPIQRTIAGKPRDGLLHATTTPMTVEVYLVPVGKMKLGVLLYRQEPHADLAKIESLLASVAEGPGEPLPEFTTTINTTPVQLFLDKPTQLALTPPVTATLTRRPTVLRTMTGNGGSLTFEHARGIAVSRMPNDQMLAVTIQTDRAAIQLFDLGMRFTVDELKNALLGQMAATDLGEVSHTHGSETIRGRKLRLANLPVEHELYVFDRGGKTIGASIQYVAADEKLVMDVALPILASVK